jgi:hypothetical protein
MFEDCSGRAVRTVAEAETYIWKFMGECRSTRDRHIQEHSHDFDLYLPWLLEIMEYQKTDRGTVLPIMELQSLYMEAAWGLVMQGYLRPGPRTISGDPLKDGYGKGYSMTVAGRERLQREKLAFSTSADSLT